MKKTLKYLILLYFFLVVIKILIASFIQMSPAFSDDYRYLKMGRSFFYEQNFNVHDLDYMQFPPLYSVFISIAHIFNNSIYVYFFIKVINALLSSMIIVPAYLLAREFISEKKSMAIAFIIALLPMSFSYTPYILSENLFYTLFLFAIYFIYRQIVYNKKIDVILAGVFTGLSMLTRLHGIVILIGLIIIFLLSLYKSKFREFNYKILIIIAIACFIFLPYGIKFFSSENNIYATEVANSISRGSILHSLYPFIIWLITYTGALILSSLIIFPFFMLYNKTENKKLAKLKVLSYSIIIPTLLIAANHHLRSAKYIYRANDWIFVSGKLIGRYIDFLIPLIIILGFIAFAEYRRNKLIKKDKKFFVILSILILVIVIASLHFLPRSLFLPNNPSLTWIGAMKQLIESLFYGKSLFAVDNSVDPIINSASHILIPLFLIIFMLFIFKFLLKINISRIYFLILIFIILVNLINFSVTYYNAKKWYESPQVKLSLWLNEHDKDKISNILIDERYYGGLKRDNQTMLYVDTGASAYTIIGYWLNDNLIIGNVNNLGNIDYVITRDNKLNFEIIKESENGIYLYEVR